MEFWEKAHEADSAAALAAFKAKNLQPVVYTAAELGKLEAAAKPIWNIWVADMTKRGNKGLELLNLILSTAQNVRS
jgi:hypothetical protein